MGRQIDSVWGFCICGSCCIGLKGKYSIALIKLSAPVMLGNPIVSSVFWDEYSLDDMKGMQLLATFIQRGKAYESHEPPKTNLALRYRIPALFSLPVSFWDDPCLISNGTLSTVFRGTQSEITDLVHKFQKLSQWDLFKKSFQRFFQTLPPNQEGHFYLKIQMKYFSINSDAMDPEMVLSSRDLKPYNEMYCIQPFKNKYLKVNLMKDCGTSLNANSFEGIRFGEFCKIFGKFWKEIMLLCEDIFHGDVLPHNIVLTSTNSLILIDWDEGTVGLDTVRRVVEKEVKLTTAIAKQSTNYDGNNGSGRKK
jgi:hypothetical protein